MLLAFYSTFAAASLGWRGQETQGGSITIRTILVASTLVILVTGCATYGEKDLKDFNAQFQAANPVDPQYSIVSLSAQGGEITLHQGAILISPTSVRHRHLEAAGQIVIAAYCEQSNSVPHASDFRRHGSSGYVHVTGTFFCAPENLKDMLNEAIGQRIFEATTCTADRAVKLMAISKDLAYIEKSALEDCSDRFEDVSKAASLLNDSPSFIESVDEFAQREARKEVRKAVLQQNSSLEPSAKAL